MDYVTEIAASWGWIGIEPEEIVGENDFGNLMIRDTSGRYWRLCPEELSCKVVANSRADLDKLSTGQSFLRDWYMRPLVEQATQAIGELTNGRKFHFAIPCVLGGGYDVSNIKNVALEEQIRFSGDIARQINELPDGAKVKLSFVN